jgi:FkbM family methyltransferase
LRHGDCFYDVGAHIGFYSLVAARLVGEGAADVAVLQENISQNSLSQVNVIPVAVWSHCGLVTFRRSAVDHPEVSSRRGAVVLANGKTFDPSLIDVDALTLDAFAEGHQPPTVIKIDVEGAEVEVLNGAQKMISETRPILLFEVHHRQAATSLQQQLRQGSYKINWLAQHPSSAFPCHLIALPE